MSHNLYYHFVKQLQNNIYLRHHLDGTRLSIMEKWVCWKYIFKYNVKRKSICYLNIIFQLSERQKLFAQRSPLYCSKAMYGGNSARSNLSKIFANTPAIHKKAVIPISPTTNNKIRTTSSILLSHISTKVCKIIILCTNSC